MLRNTILTCTAGGFERLATKSTFDCATSIKLINSARHLVQIISTSTCNGRLLCFLWTVEHVGLLSVQEEYSCSRDRVCNQYDENSRQHQLVNRHWQVVRRKPEVEDGNEEHADSTQHSERDRRSWKRFHAQSYCDVCLNKLLTTTDKFWG